MFTRKKCIVVQLRMKNVSLLKMRVYFVNQENSQKVRCHYKRTYQRNV